MKPGLFVTTGARCARANLAFARPRITVPRSEVQQQKTKRQVSEPDGGETTSTPDVTPPRVPRSDELELTFPTVLRFRSKNSILEAMHIRNSSASGRPLRLRKSHGSSSTKSLLPPTRTRRLDDRSVQPADAIFPVPVRRIDELIWRRTAQTISDVVKRVHQLETSHEQDAAAAGSVAIRQETVPALSATTSSGSISQLDPSLVDRLADHVIRKVDKRMRIERERRGL